MGQAEANYVAELLQVRIYTPDAEPWEDLNRIRAIEYLGLDQEPFWIVVVGQAQLLDGRRTPITLNIIQEGDHLMLAGAVG